MNEFLTITQEPCPKCEIMHLMKDYERFEEEGKIIFSPPDVLCPCGLILRWTDPLFKMSGSGCELRCKKDSEKIRLCSSEWKKDPHISELRSEDLLLIDDKILATVTGIDMTGWIFTGQGIYPWSVKHTFKLKKKE